MSDKIELPESTPTLEADLHAALRESLKAILLLHTSATLRLTPKQVDDMKRRLDDGSARLALFASIHGNCVSAQLAVIPAAKESMFTKHLIRLTGSILAACAGAEDVTVDDFRLLH